MDATERQFARLTQLVLDGIASDAERAELSRLSATHPELVNSVIDELHVGRLLNWQSGNISWRNCHLWKTVLPVATVRLCTQSRKAIPMWTWVIAATVLIATGLAAWRIAGTQSLAISVIADIVHQQGVDLVG